MSKFSALLDRATQSVQDDYDHAHAQAVSGDSQRAGHGGEATWAGLLEQWGPGWPVVTRKYVVGPGGTSNEVDVILLRPDYPQHLHSEPEILASGVAAAFSSKLTLRKKDIIEAIQQKKLLVEVAGATPQNVQEALRGPFPFGLLSHSTDLFKSSDDFGTAMRELYIDLTEESSPPLVSHPREELDALLIANKAFFSGSRISLAPVGTPTADWSPVSTFNYHDANSSTKGVPLVQFVTWLAAAVSNGRHHALESLEPMFSATSSSGFMRPWSRDIYPDHIRDDVRQLLTNLGGPIMV
ncbi:DUF6602 domain-containing protein [Herbiconiux sp.]|uniref:DUF6602 domain-containing protein n=1 Tax=Herbiconiux sp. TaxID=1871186 RepID=UPI0025BAB663|nr:DUF6602 domain-containing protein [Herbiconiux sp.]